MRFGAYIESQRVDAWKDHYLDYSKLKNLLSVLADNSKEGKGKADVAALFRSSAQGETGHAHGHLEFLEQVGDPATGLPMGNTRENLAAALASETNESVHMYPAMALTAREEGFDEIADWFETLAKAERSHTIRYEKALKELLD
jgi:rubrerythrin